MMICIQRSVLGLVLISSDSFLFLNFHSTMIHHPIYSHTAQHEQNDEINDLRAFLISSGAVADATPQFMSGGEK